MQYIKTAEGYPALLKTRTRSKLLFERDLTHKNRKTPWVYLTQNPRGRWQVLAPDPAEPGEIVCIAGGKTAHVVLKPMIQHAVDLGILKRGTRSFRDAVFSLGRFAEWHSNQERG